MAGKKRKKPRKKREIQPVFLLAILPTALACLILVIAKFYPFNKAVTPKPVPPYEEVYTKATELREKIKRIDHAIYGSFYKAGIREKNVAFLQVRPRGQGARIWDFTELSVGCSDRNSALQLQSFLTQDLKACGPRISFRNEVDSKGNLIFHVFAKESYTHKIVLTFRSREEPGQDGSPKIAIIIDDLGYDGTLAFSLFRLPVPISFSILPFAPLTDVIVRETNRWDAEAILHLPMQPREYPAVDPGPGALLLSMNENEIRKVLDEDLRRIQGAKGVNNHMGSSFTESKEKMAVVLEELKRRDLFYVDSLTTNRTVGFKLAKKMGVLTARRSVFLDNDLTQEAINIQMERLMSVARHSGSAIGIGHPHKETLRALEKYVPKLQEDFEVVAVSELVN